jgi:peptide/nickel transport system permease protein
VPRGGTLPFGLEYLRRLHQTRLARAAAVVVAVMTIVALAPGTFAPYDPTAQHYSTLLQPPNLAHPFGTDQLGRDMLSQVVYGSRISLGVGFGAVALGSLSGVLIGLISGYIGGHVDNTLMRLMDVLWSFPALVLALGLTAALGPGVRNLIIAIGVVNIPAFARLVRGQTLSVREQDYIAAVRAAGARVQRIMLCHVLPNVTPAVIVQTSLAMAYAILAEASLSFLGFGVQSPTPTWGGMLRVGYDFTEQAPWLGIFPGFAIFITVLSFNLLGDGLRNTLDPRLRTHAGALRSSPALSRNAESRGAGGATDAPASRPNES